MKIKRMANLFFLLALMVSACNLQQPPKPQASVASPAQSSAVTLASTQAAIPNQLLAEPQIGLNFIRFYWSNKGNGLDTSTPYLQPEYIFVDFQQLGVHTYRQFVKADLLWDVVEPRDDQWNFAQADIVLANPDFEPIVTLFSMQYTSPTPPWAKTPQEFQKEIGLEATDYLTMVVKRYAPYVRYWEIGNEMVHWRSADPGSTQTGQGAEKLPASYPLEGYSPQEQGVFLAQTARIIRTNDPDAIILMPGLPSLDEYSVQTWLAGVLEGGGKDWFDVVNYHYYGDWQRFTLLRPQFQASLQTFGIADRPVWLTETGASSNPELTIRTDYPNSPGEQAADVFRRIVQAWGLGDRLVQWHTYIGSSETEGDWSAYGILTENGIQKPAYQAFKLLTAELLPYASVEAVSSDARGLNVYRVTTLAGMVRYVAWGQGKFTVPQGITHSVSVVPSTDGYEWQPVQAGQELVLSQHPILLKE